MDQHWAHRHTFVTSVSYSIRRWPWQIISVRFAELRTCTSTTLSYPALPYSRSHQITCARFHHVQVGLRKCASSWTSPRTLEEAPANTEHRCPDNYLHTTPWPHHANYQATALASYQTSHRIENTSTRISMHQRHGTAVSCRHAKETMLDRPHAFFTATPVGSAADKARELRRSLSALDCGMRSRSRLSASILYRCSSRHSKRTFLKKNYVDILRHN